MATALTDNFSYQGSLPNFARDSFDTLDAMKGYPEYCLDDGHLSFCKEDRNTYRFDSTNEIDGTTGKWRLFSGTAVTEFDLSEDFTVPANHSKTMETVYCIKVGDHAYSIGASPDIRWVNGEQPVAKSGTVCVISVLNNLGVWGEF